MKAEEGTIDYSVENIMQPKEKRKNLLLIVNAEESIIKENFKSAQHN